MPRRSALSTLTKLFDQSSRPLYVVDGERRIAYCNAALVNWLDLESAQIIGRLVEYHSVVGSKETAAHGDDSPLTELCPPPRAFAGEPCLGTISRLDRSGSLLHRQAEFLPLDAPVTDAATSVSARRSGAVLALLAGNDLPATDLNGTKSDDPSADELHGVVRQFRRSQAHRYAVESLLGGSDCMRKVRAQVAAAAASVAHCVIFGPRGSACGDVARAIHYQSPAGASAKLVPIDCQVANDDLIRRALQALGKKVGDGQPQSTLVLENLSHLSPIHQGQLLATLQRGSLPGRVVATIETCPNNGAERESEAATELDCGLVDALSTMTIHVPRLVDRIEDLPLLAQSFLESCNRGNDHQIGSIRHDALDLLALHRWPGDVAELGTVISAAHGACRSHQITPADLPPIVHHAAQVAARSPRQPERIVLDDLLANVEREAIVRALAAVKGNKTEAADLLGMTRPRLYRRMVQLGLVEEPVPSQLEMPEFIEQDPTDSPT